MNVWLEKQPGGQPVLVGSEGELVSVSIAVEPRLLEKLLDSLAELPFPVNPQIYHDAWVARVYADGRRETEPATMVEFPAYAARLAGIRGALARSGFDPDSVWAKNMLEQIHSEYESGPAPPGAPYTSLLRCRRLSTAA
jgi:hypothetical protein